MRKSKGSTRDFRGWQSRSARTSWQRVIAFGPTKKGLTLHGLRHTLGTMLREAGIDAETRKLIVGHADTNRLSNTAVKPGLPDDVKAKLVGPQMTERRTKL